MLLATASASDRFLAARAVTSRDVNYPNADPNDKKTEETMNCMQLLEEQPE